VVWCALLLRGSQRRLAQDAIHIQRGIQSPDRSMLALDVIQAEEANAVVKYLLIVKLMH
jgi:hypothetical protein